MTNFEYTTHNGNTMHLTATDFAKLRDAIGSAGTSKNALKVDAFSNAEAFAYYKDIVFKVQCAVAHRVKAARESNMNIEQAETAFYAAFQSYLDMFCADYKAANFDIMAFASVSGTYRNVGTKDEPRYAWLPMGEQTFRKQFERTVSDMFSKAQIKTVEEIRAERKARDKAKREAAKAKKNAALNAAA